jgi:hypothetical protein
VSLALLLNNAQGVVGAKNWNARIALRVQWERICEACQSDDCFLPVPMAAICSLFDFSLPWERFHVQCARRRMSQANSIEIESLAKRRLARLEMITLKGRPFLEFG